jgi:putative sterol carrier protein/DNA-directed RNA polymerase subunit RPC12/RpoP
MKPKTILQKRVVEISQYLPKILDHQKQWAYKECLEHRGYATKNRVLCLDCGETFSPNLVSRKRATCPHCKTKIQIKESRCTTDNQKNYFAICDTLYEFQIVRNFELIAHYKKGQPVKYLLHEILQYWIQPNLKVTMFGLNHTTSGFCDSWGGNMEIRIQSTKSWNRSKYDVYARKYHPDSEIKPEYKKLGIDCNLTGLTFLEAVEEIPYNSKLETLLKAKQYFLINAHINQNGRSVSYYWDSIKICLRKKYKVKDASIWMDYIDLLRYFDKDIRNAKYVCPKNLKLEHDRLMKKKREILAREEREHQRQQIIKRQQNLEKAMTEYVERNKKFFGLEIKDKNISISVLKSVEEFKEEGDELKHCVYTNEYYLKEKSLILSAKVDGKRAETIELILPTLKIEQSRGMNNNPTEHHKKIIQLVTKNLSKIKKLEYPTHRSRKIKQVT